MPASPGFKTVTINPALGPLKNVKGKLFLPDFNDYIEIELMKEGDKLKGQVYLPEGLSGIFIRNGQSIPLTGGKQRIDP
jgi:hypothetical protein